MAGPNIIFIDQEFMYEYANGKNYATVREMLRAAGSVSNYSEETGLSEFDYYLQNLQRVDPLKTFQDDWSVGLLSEAMTILCRDTKCEAILHYIVDHKNVKIRDDHIVEASKYYESIAFKLIEKGANVHHVKYYNRYNSLHTAALAGFTNLVEYLLKCKVDPNALSTDLDNALHCACIKGRLDTIKLLVETDVNIYMRQKPFRKTPIEIAILTEHFDAAILILESKIADNLEFDLAQSLFRSLCCHALGSPNSLDLTLFELIWEKLVKSFSSYPQRESKPWSIISTYLNNRIFLFNNWYYALKVILTSTIAPQLLEEFASLNGPNLCALFITTCCRAHVEKENRMELLEILVALGVKPNLQDLATTLLYFKNQDEFDLLNLHFVDDCKEDNLMQHVASVFCGLRHQVDFQIVEIFDKKYYNFITQYFTDDSNAKMINIPSLKELCRNAARKSLIDNPEILLPKHFIDAVNSLRIPVKHKQFLMLKIPLDEF